MRNRLREPNLGVRSGESIQLSRPATGETVPVDSPDWISLSGRLESDGAEVSFLVATVPSNPSGNHFEIYGKAGTLVITGGAVSSGQRRLLGSRGK